MYNKFSILAIAVITYLQLWVWENMLPLPPPPTNILKYNIYWMKNYFQERNTIVPW